MALAEQGRVGQGQECNTPEKQCVQNAACSLGTQRTSIQNAQHVVVGWRGHVHVQPLATTDRLQVLRPLLLWRPERHVLAFRPFAALQALRLRPKGSSDPCRRHKDKRNKTRLIPPQPSACTIYGLSADPRHWTAQWN